MKRRLAVFALSVLRRFLAGLWESEVYKYDAQSLTHLPTHAKTTRPWSAALDEVEAPPHWSRQPGACYPGV